MTKYSDQNRTYSDEEISYTGEELFYDPRNALFAVFARKKFGKPGVPGLAGLGGIYRLTPIKGELVNQRLPYYEPTNPQTEEQQAWRAKLADAVAEWQSLTSEEKADYNEKAKGKRMSGYNLFIREFLLSD